MTIQCGTMPRRSVAAYAVSTMRRKHHLVGKCCKHQWYSIDLKELEPVFTSGNSYVALTSSAGALMLRCAEICVDDDNNDNDITDHFTPCAIARVINLSIYPYI